MVQWKSGGDVPGNYVVHNRNLPEPTFGGLALPFSPAQGRLMLPGGATNLKEVYMANLRRCRRWAK
jgi:hypothetical protein